MSGNVRQELHGKFVHVFFKTPSLFSFKIERQLRGIYISTDFSVHRGAYTLTKWINVLQLHGCHIRRTSSS